VRATDVYIMRRASLRVRTACEHVTRLCRVTVGLCAMHVLRVCVKLCVGLQVVVHEVCLYWAVRFRAVVCAEGC